MILTVRSQKEKQALFSALSVRAEQIKESILSQVEYMHTSINVDDCKDSVNYLMDMQRDLVDTDSLMDRIVDLKFDKSEPPDSDQHL
jgi:hypothetical protein